MNKGGWQRSKVFIYRESVEQCKFVRSTTEEVYLVVGWAESKFSLGGSGSMCLLSGFSSVGGFQS